MAYKAMLSPEIDGIVLHPKEGVKVVEWQDKTLFGWVTVVWIMPVLTREQVEQDVRDWFESKQAEDDNE